MKSVLISSFVVLAAIFAYAVGVYDGVSAADVPGGNDRIVKPERGSKLSPQVKKSETDLEIEGIGRMIDNIERRRAKKEADTRKKLRQPLRKRMPDYGDGEAESISIREFNGYLVTVFEAGDGHDYLVMQMVKSPIVSEWVITDPVHAAGCRQCSKRIFPQRASQRTYP